MAASNNNNSNALPEPRNSPDYPRGMDPEVVALLRAIRWNETSSTSFKDGPKLDGASGEKGRFQFMPETWDTYQKMHLPEEERIPFDELNEPSSREVEQKVMYLHIQKNIEDGYSPEKIFVEHNAGSGRWKSDWDEDFASGGQPWVKWHEEQLVKTGATNDQGVRHNLPRYVEKGMDSLGVETGALGEPSGGGVQDTREPSGGGLQGTGEPRLSPEQIAFDRFRKNPKNLDHFVGAVRGN